ncbi:hypothetical protein EO238_25815, partial [Citrobacter sp. AAK_AS5]
MRLHRLVVALGIALATFSVVSLFDPGLCFAQRTSRSPGSVDSIRRFMEKGQALFASGQYVKAAEVFDAGFEMHP